MAKDTTPTRILSARWDDYDSFTVVEAGEILKLGRNKSYDAVAKGDLPTIRIGHTLRVPRHVIERILTGTGYERKGRVAA
jgi:excisionase family DNA binding protein